ncbi:MAG TPA: HAD family phosphatase [Acidobacteriota bacterium]|nr:HAD family phosphatase [Acidobacteriota bacterium]
MRIRGIIFDFNGVIVDDEPLHAEAVLKTLKEEGIELSRETYYDKYLPFDDYHCIQKILQDHGEPCDEARIRDLMRRKAHHYDLRIRQSIPALTGSIEFVRSLPPELPAIIASGAAKREIEYILKELDLCDRFVSVIASGDVTNSKPHPEAFIKAFGILKNSVPDLTHDEVLVFEDSYRGVEAAAQAGLKCVGICTSYPPERLKAADLVIQSLDGWTIERLENAIP